MPMTRMLTRITSTITISHMTPLLRSEKEVEVRRDMGNISVMVDVECENDRIDPWAEANISAFLTVLSRLFFLHQLKSISIGLLSSVMVIFGRWRSPKMKNCMWRISMASCQSKILILEV